VIRTLVIVGAFATGALALAPMTALAADAPSSPAPAAPSDTLLSFHPATIQALDGTTRPAEMGRLWVPETHARPDGKKINFAFLRLKSRSASTGPPIVFLPGGPGYPGTFLARTPEYLRLFERLSEHSDVIVIDQRGAGLSEPSLQCATRGSLPPEAFESEARVASALGAMVRSCVRMMRRDGYAIEAYNTAESVEDLEDLRRALGVDRLRLLAGSYGTELALETIRRHGDRIESAALAGIRGPDMTWRFPSTRDLQLHRLSMLVAADPKWARTLPDLEGSVRRLIERLRWKPLWVAITDAKTDQAIRVRVGPVAIQAVVGSDVNEPDWAPMLPAMMASLAAGDSTLFVRRVEDLFNGTGSGVSIMQIATDCASGASPDRRARVASEARTAILGNVKNVFVNPAFCELAGTPELDASYRTPVASKVRALFLTGSMDAITPPDQAEEVRSRFPNGTLLVVENGWHEVLPASDVQSVVSDFFDGKDVQPRKIRLEPLRFLTIEEAKAVTASDRK
jgi:pimeloyl-ACP methyl ester carboxylesterase